MASKALPAIGDRVRYKAGWASPIYSGVVIAEGCDDGTCKAIHVAADEPAGAVHHVPRQNFGRDRSGSHWATKEAPGASQ